MTVETIPDRWIGGYLQTHPDQTVRDAVDWWMDQARMERQWIEEHAEDFTIMESVA